MLFSHLKNLYDLSRVFTSMYYRNLLGSFPNERESFIYLVDFNSDNPTVSM